MVQKNLESPNHPKLDWVMWFIAILLLIAGLVANYYYNNQPWPIRLLAWLLLLSAIGGALFQTSQGRRVFQFARESKLELKKVFWPSRQETMQTTMFVGIMVIVLALVLWGVDSILMWLIGWLTGQRG